MSTKKRILLVDDEKSFTTLLKLNLEDTGTRMARLATSMVLRDRVLPLDQFLALIDAVTVDDVQRVAARVLGVAPSIAVVGPVRKRRSGSAVRAATSPDRSSSH